MEVYANQNKACPFNLVLHKEEPNIGTKNVKTYN